MPTLTAILLLCTFGASSPSALTSIDPPAPSGAASPAITSEDLTTITREHELLLTWLEPDGKLRFSRRSRQSWSPAVTIADGVAVLDPRDRPALTVLDTQGVRRTLIARTGDTVARSADAGRTWTRLPVAALPFASFAAGDEGGWAFWLETVPGGATHLLGTRILAGRTVLDTEATTGWSTAAAMTWDGPVVAYRTTGANPIAVVSRQEGRWNPPLPIPSAAALAGSSHGGPRVAVLERRVAVAWLAETAGATRALVAFSNDAGQSFGTPLEIDTGKGERAAADAVDVALDKNGDALVLRRVGTSTQAALELVRVTPEGKHGDPLALTPMLAIDTSSGAQITRADDRLAVTWVDAGTRRVRATEVPTAAILAPGTPKPTADRAPRSSVYRGAGRVGEPFPGFELTSLAGTSISVPALAGKVVLVNFWATWCLPCLEEMPELAALHERWAEKGLVVVGVSVDDAEAAEKVRGVVEKREIPFAVWLDPEMKVYRALRLRELPASFLLDESGTIVLRRDQPITADDPGVTEALSRLLGAS